MSATTTKKAAIMSNISVDVSTVSMSGRIEDVKKCLKHLNDSLDDHPPGIVISTRMDNPKITYQTKEIILMEKEAGLRDAARNGSLEDVKKYLNDGDVNVDGKDQK